MSHADNGKSVMLSRGRGAARGILVAARVILVPVQVHDHRFSSVYNRGCRHPWRLFRSRLTCRRWKPLSQPLLSISRADEVLCDAYILTSPFDCALSELHFFPKLCCKVQI
ncbi:hypothetical protein PIB30_017092 [Stylosanthes scabra]|uniref:Uncharacterized protein n=1 Tax=Stylosanthes scabra TaxID=79078 RepID=A0ABU6T8Q6_9FABA|nr:hypothetical protein [Stylosanthes scabra]